MAVKAAAGTALPDFEPIIIESRPDGEDIPMVELFRIDGKSYSIPAAPPAGQALQIVEDTMTYGSGVAEMMMLRRVIGPDAYKALAECSGTKGGHLAKIAQAVTTLALGALEDEDEGNS